jgi:response regulator RpfG family c-di-GMP phosphodiesterase
LALPDNNDNKYILEKPNSMLKIALVDDHQIVREGFKQLIELEPYMLILAKALSSASPL